MTSERDRERSRKWYAANKDRVREYGKKYRQRDDVKTRDRERSRVAYAAHPEKAALRVKRHRERNKEKHNMWAKRWRDANLERVRENERKRYRRTLERERAYKSIPTVRLRCLITNAKTRATKRGMPYDQAAMQAVAESPPMFCACCSKPLDYDMGKGRGHMNAADAPSIDRIDNARGYVSGNVAVICCRCNWVKNDSTPSELQTVLNYMLRAGDAKQLKVVANG